MPTEPPPPSARLQSEPGVQVLVPFTLVMEGPLLGESAGTRSPAVVRSVRPEQRTSPSYPDEETQYMFRADLSGRYGRSDPLGPTSVRPSRCQRIRTAPEPARPGRPPRLRRTSPVRDDPTPDQHGADRPGDRLGRLLEERAVQQEEIGDGTGDDAARRPAGIAGRAQVRIQRLLEGNAFGR